MSPQLASPHAPVLPTDDDNTTAADSTPLYSSFEHFEPGLQFLSNDPVAEDERHVMWQQQKQQKQQRELRQNNTATAAAPGITGPRSDHDDAEFVDLLYIVDPAGKTTVMNLASPSGPEPEPASAVPAPPTSTSSDPYALPAEHDDPNQRAYLPPLSAAFNPSSTATKVTIIAGSGSARALLGTELDLEEANELDYEAKLMSWWPRPEEDELKVERM
jgi:hypothetical protein